MESGYVPFFAISLQDEDIVKLRLKSYEEFESLLNNYQVDLDNYSHHTAGDDVIEFENIGSDSDEDRVLIDKRTRDLSIKYKSFTDEFKKETNMEIGLDYHDSEDYGSEHDDIDGVFYTLEFNEVYKPTYPATLLMEKVKINTDYKYVSRESSVNVIEININELKRLNLKSLEHFLDRLDKYKISLDNFAKANSDSDYLYIEDNVITENKESFKGNDEIVIEISNELSDLFLKFCSEFTKETNLPINIEYHNSVADGSHNDDVDGHYFYIDFYRFYEKTEEAKRLEEKVSFKNVNYVFYT